MSRVFETVKGTYEYLPAKQVLRERIKSTLQATFIKYGFAPVETPILTSYELLASKYSEGADILNEMYTLSDRGKRKLGLRYDLTVAFCKLISSNGEIVLPFKRYEIGKVFRDGPVRVGRNREFTQCDVDMVGVDSMLAEAEYMTMTAEAYRNLGLDIVIKFNNRKLLSGIISYVCGDVDEDLNRKIIMLIDKFAKMSEEDLRTQFDEIGVAPEKYHQLRGLLSCDFDTLLKKLAVVEDNALLNDGINEVKELYAFLAGTEAVKKMIFSPYLARGIDIYTGTVWEVFLQDGIIKTDNEVIDFTNTSIGGGGRYDKIITSFIDDGKIYPAVGMTFGLDVIYEVLIRQKDSGRRSYVDLFVIPMGTERESFAFVTSLRAAGLNVEFEKNHRRVKKCMDYANKSKIPYTCVIGSNEVENKCVMIKDMESGERMEFSFDDIEGIKRYVLL